jgi:hypothetical protein
MPRGKMCGRETKRKHGQTRNFALVSLKSDGDTLTGASCYAVRILSWEVARRLLSVRYTDVSGVGCVLR